MKSKIIHPKNWKPAKGYANGILASNGHLFIGGQIGWDSQKIFNSNTFIGQMEQTLINIVQILEEAGVPNGVFNVITASRDRTPEVGDELMKCVSTKPSENTAVHASIQHVIL